MPHVITLTGPSGAGKSTTLRYFLDYANSSFRPEMVPKYTTRPPHDDDEGEVICGKVIPDKCDLVYEQYGVRYGLELETIFDLVAKEKQELEILSNYLPQEMAGEELEKLVKESIKELGVVGPSDFGRVMGVVMGKVKGRIDGTKVSEVVKKLI